MPPTSVSLQNSNKPRAIHTNGIHEASAMELIRRNIEDNVHLYSGGNSPSSGELVSIHLTAGILDWEEDELPGEVISNPPDLIMYVY